MPLGLPRGLFTLYYFKALNAIMKKATLLHLRIPFSFFLLPVFLFSVSTSEQFDLVNVGLIFFILHILVYPASNGYNSYFDKDKESIGGLKNPPAVSKELYWTTLVMDLAALILSIIISWQFALMVFVYGLISKAYSHPSVRLKKLPITGWLAAGIFQGYFTFLMVYLGVQNLDVTELMRWEIQFPALLSTALLMGSYPMTQVYQHKEDSERGDITISLKLGVLGTFHFTAIAFFFSNFGFLVYYYLYQSMVHVIAFQIFLLPVLFYFTIWYLKVRKDLFLADFEHTMRLNLISSLMLNIYFLLASLY